MKYLLYITFRSPCNSKIFLQKYLSKLEKVFCKSCTWWIFLRLCLSQALPNYPQCFWFQLLRMAPEYYLYQLMCFPQKYFSYDRDQRNWMIWSGRCYTLEENDSELLFWCQGLYFTELQDFGFHFYFEYDTRVKYLEFIWLVRESENNFTSNTVHQRGRHSIK